MPIPKRKKDIGRGSLAKSARYVKKQGYPALAEIISPRKKVKLPRNFGELKNEREVYRKVAKEYAEKTDAVILKSWKSRSYRPKRKKVARAQERVWNLAEIKLALGKAYQKIGRDDDWGVQVVYLDVLLPRLYNYLPKSKGVTKK